jgi:FMN reductase
MLGIAGAAVDAAGGELRTLHLGDLDLPVMRMSDADQKKHAGIASLRESAAWAHGFLIGTPEYHGTMSGALKNAFDFLYGELAGKFAGVIATTGGGSGDLSITTVKRTFAWCHGFTLPFHAAADRHSFSGGVLKNEKTRDRLERIGHDLVRYSAALTIAWQDAQACEGTASGVAGLHK